jgi:hypothetical protein
MFFVTTNHEKVLYISIYPFGLGTLEQHSMLKTPLWECSMWLIAKCASLWVTKNKLLPKEREEK